MKCYLDITLQPNADIALYFLWEKLYQQFHIALVESQNADEVINVGVAFPEYDSEKNQLGSVLRIFAFSEGVLDNLNINKWLSRLKDYVEITSIINVPEKVDGYVCFKRMQPKGNNERLARRMAKRKNISYGQALLHFKNREEEQSKLPFIQIKSHSSDQRYRLIIARVEAASANINEGFSTYGLSSKSTVPLF